MFTGNMNGTWKLFVFDDDGTGDQGVISGGYTINFDLGAPFCQSAPATVVVTVGQQFTITQMPASLVVCDGLIAWLGLTDELPNIYAGIQHIGCDDRLLTPALIDCHTHVVFAGNRAPCPGFPPPPCPVPRLPRTVPGISHAPRA